MATGREMVQDLRTMILRDPLVGGSFEEDEFNLWQNLELLNYINEAINEACLRSKLLVDSVTPAICEIAVVTGTNEYDVDERVYSIERAKLDDKRFPLTKKSQRWLDDHIHQWELRDGRTDYYVWENKKDKLRLVGIPDADDTLRLTVWRKQLAPILYDTSPEIDSEHHYNLLHWAASLAYLKPGSQSYDQDKATLHANMFASFFGPRPDLDVLEQRRRDYSRRAPARFY